MNILIVSQYYWPETFIISELAETLVKQGHTVEVFTGKPNYPEGKIFKGYSALRCQKEIVESVPVNRIPIIPRGKNIFGRLMNYSSFVLSGLYYFPKLIKGKNFDAVLVFLPSPIISVIPAIYLKRKSKAHLAVWVQDLWPESAEATGFVKNKFILRQIEKIVRWVYKNSDTLLAQSNAFIHSINKYAPQEKISYFPNPFPDPVETGEGILSVEFRHILDNNKCIVFAGNLGRAQAVETIIQAAIEIKNLPDCKIILVGSGSKLEWVKKEIEKHSLTNIYLAGRYPLKQMDIIFSKACALLVTLKDEKIFSYTIPSKIQAYLAAGKPIIGAINGEAAEIIKKSKAGLTCQAEDAKQLAKLIEQVYHMALSDREAMGEAGREYFLTHFEINKQSHELIKILEQRMCVKES